MEGPGWAKRRFEYWHQASGMAWVARDETYLHAQGAAALHDFLGRVQQVRGSRIETRGSVSLRMRQADGSPGNIMQPDLLVYVHPDRARRPAMDRIVEGRHDWPDVVLEVDNTTDVRRNKLRLYEEWGLPELWVEVPEKRPRSRPANLRPGCTLYRLESGAYRESGESGAFPGLMAWEIHRMLNDVDDPWFMTEVARRLGRRLGDAEGTAASADPLSRWFLETGHREGLDEARRERLDEGERRGAVGVRARMVAEVLRNRGVALSPGFPDRLPGVLEALALADESQIAAAALRAADEADFAARLAAAVSG